ncbi:MAG: phenylalanine--tRNA ligase subunit alpha [Defluviitaleaceae bacterium]|nr:phenylalanine--tRNA ligase subunit alpha [Defluviitaleaceae bacterium]MCL2836071.1 phenylalanine--tRNA ligase subunit alpha [Defluviitaleaceae bacterium]
MIEKIRGITASAVAAADKAGTVRELEELRVEVLGKKGSMTQILKGMGALPPDERPLMGQAANDARAEIEKRLEARQAVLRMAELEERLANEVIDVTMPGRAQKPGGRHPMTIMIEDLCRIFTGMGYEIAEGPEIETDYNNFIALNTPEHHSSRDEQDTFYMEGDGGFLLRTQTSPMQVRYMMRNRPPIRVICPGKVFRSDEIDATHTPVFHQMEGLVVDKGITLGHLKGALTTFARELFGADTAVRFRPHYFPFTEPSGEMDVRCYMCLGKGCRVCKGEGWVELLGCGMVHPNVLKMRDIDPDVYSGFAFGMGLERVALARFRIPDIRILFENDVRFLRQFA